jgi:hypothetical protein
MNTKLQAENLTDENEKMETRIAFISSWARRNELDEAENMIHQLRQERDEIESATKGAILEQPQKNEAVTE